MASSSDHAARLIAAGYRVWPIDGRTKQPTRAGFSRAAGPYVCATPADFPYGTEVGVLCGPCPIAGGGRLVCVDLDGDVPAEEYPQGWPVTLTSKDRHHLWYIVDADSSFRQTAGVRKGVDGAGDGWAIDTRDFGGYARETTGGVGLWDSPPDAPNAITRLTESQVAELFPPAPAVASATPPPVAGPEPWDRASVVRTFGAGPNTNYLAGGVGRVLHQHAGWAPEAVRAYVHGILTGLGHPDAARHADTAARAATADSRAWGIPRLRAAGVVFHDAPRPMAGDDVSAILLAEDVRDTRAAGPFARLVSAADIAAWDPPPIPWLVEALAMAPGAPCLITGYGGSGKTTFVQHVALAVATPGASVLGEYPVRHGSVLHVDHEQGIDLTKRRYRRLGVTAEARLDLVSFPRWSLGDTSPEARGAFIEACRGRALVIIDSLLASTAAFLEDENASGAREPLDYLTHVSEVTGAVVLVIHHSKKDRSDRMTSARGTSAITDAVSVHITFEREDLDARTRPVLALGKVRNERTPQTLAGDVEVAMAPRGAPADGGYTLVGVDPSAAENARAASLSDQVVALFATGWAGSANQVVEELGTRRTDTLNTVRELVEDGTLERSGRGLRLSGSVQ
jgi:KaiC/GvpD/RAD55 family RecA-like ATPase